MISFKNDFDWFYFILCGSIGLHFAFFYYSNFWKNKFDLAVEQAPNTISVSILKTAPKIFQRQVETIEPVILEETAESEPIQKELLEVEKVIEPEIINSNQNFIVEQEKTLDHVDIITQEVDKDVLIEHDSVVKLEDDVSSETIEKYYETLESMKQVEESAVIENFVEFEETVAEEVVKQVLGQQFHDLKIESHNEVFEKDFLESPIHNMTDQSYDSNKLKELEVIEDDPLIEDQEVVKENFISEESAGSIIEAKPIAFVNPAPKYPKIAQRKSWEGTVVLKLVIGSNGLVDDVQVAESSGYSSLDKSALRTVRRWKFEAASQMGSLIQSTIFIPVEFRLDKNIK